jgi:1-acyl-sn-glycerol-3-phosphate acyltransferase
VPAWERARTQLAHGRSIGVFPEGTVNRHPHRLLPGRRGAARLSLETGTPIVPVGIRYPRAQAGRPIGDDAAMIVEIGAPLWPQEPMPMAPLDDVRAWHAVMMREIARLSGRDWSDKIWSDKLSSSLTEEIGDEHP